MWVCAAVRFSRELPLTSLIVTIVNLFEREASLGCGGCCGVPPFSGYHSGAKLQKVFEGRYL